MSGKKDPSQKQVLEDLDVVEVSIVPEGENDRVFAIFKSHGGLPGMDPILKILNGTQWSGAAKLASFLESEEVPAETRQAVAAGVSLIMKSREVLPADVMEEISSVFVEDDGVETISKALSTEARRKLPSSAFAIPSTRSYPINDLVHARNALARSSGKPEAATVQAAVYAKYPRLSPVHKADCAKLPVKKSVDGSEVLDVDAIPEDQRQLAQIAWDAQVKEKEAVAKAASLTEALNTQRSEKMEKEIVEKAAKLAKLGATQEDVQAVLKAAGEKSPETLSLVEKILGAANGAVEKAEASAAEAVTKAKAAEDEAAKTKTDLEEVRKSVTTLTAEVKKLTDAAPPAQSRAGDATDGPAAGKDAVNKAKESVFKGAL